MTILGGIVPFSLYVLHTFDPKNPLTPARL